MVFLLLVLLLLFVVIMVVILTNIVVVPEHMVYVIEKFSSFNAIWEAGRYFKMPFIEKVAYRVPLNKQVVIIPPNPAITDDNITIRLDAEVHYFVSDPKLFVYSNAIGVPKTMEHFILRLLRNMVGELDLEIALDSRLNIGESVYNELKKEEEKWGVTIDCFDLKNIVPPASIAEIIEKRKKQELESLYRQNSSNNQTLI